MAFNVDNFYQQTPNSIEMNNCPGMFGYFSTTDDWATVSANGYFPPAEFTDWANPGELVMISCTDKAILQMFDSNFYLVNPF